MKKILAYVLLMTITLTTLVFPTGVYADTLPDLNVVWIGGSFTEGSAFYTEAPQGLDGVNKNYVDRVGEWLTTKYAGQNVVHNYNVGIGGTGSTYGRLRLEKDVVSKNPDVVIIEFTGNDLATGSDVINSLESIIRRLQSLGKPVKIAFLYRGNFYKDLPAKPIYNEVAKYYNIFELDAEPYAKVLAAQNGYAWTDLCSHDSTHPNSLGYYFLAEAMKKELTDREINYPEKRTVPMTAGYTPILPTYIDASNSSYITASTSTTVNGTNLVVAAGGSVTYAFNGTALGIVSNGFTGTSGQVVV